jgi:hypothetical protein
MRRLYRGGGRGDRRAGSGRPGAAAESCGSGTPPGDARAAQQPLQVGAGETPGKGDRRLLVAALEAQPTVLDLAQIGEVVGVKTLR